MAFTQVASLIYIEGSFELLTHPLFAYIQSVTGEQLDIHELNSLIGFPSGRRTLFLHSNRLAALRSVSLRLQSLNQKTLTDYHWCNGVFTRIRFFVWFIFWFSFDLDCTLTGQMGFQTDFAVKETPQIYFFWTRIGLASVRHLLYQG